MKIIDSRPLGGGVQLTMEDIHAAGTKYTNNRISFAAFIGGLRLHPDLLLDQQLTQSVGASGRSTFFSYVMHHVIPNTYDIQHLANLGGSFALGIQDVGSFTVTLLNRRVVTLKGLPVDLQGQNVLDSSIRADAFLALFNGFLVQLAQKALLPKAA